MFPMAMLLDSRIPLIQLYRQASWCSRGVSFCFPEEPFGNSWQLLAVATLSIRCLGSFYEVVQRVPLQ